MGAGVVGSAVACSLGRQGWEVTIVDQAHGLRSGGRPERFVEVTANATRALDRIAPGWEEDASPWCYAGQRWESTDGSPLYELSLGCDRDAIWGAASWLVEESRLVEAMQKRFSGVEVRWGERCTSVRGDRPQAEVVLRGGEVLSADLVVLACGAPDGSGLRLGPSVSSDPPVLGLDVRRTLLEGAMLGEVAAPDRPGGRFDWFGEGVAARALRAGGAIDLLCVTDPGDPSAALEWLASIRRPEGWSEELRRAVSVVGGMQPQHVDVGQPATRHVDGCVVAVGEAVGATAPQLGQGDALGIESAWVLSACLRKASNLREALSEYEQRRVPRVLRAQRFALFLQRDAQLAGEHRDSRDARLAGLMEADPDGRAHWGWLYAYDTLAAADRPLATERARMIWGTIFKPEEIVSGPSGMRKAHRRFVAEHLPMAPDVVVEPIDDSATAFWVGTLEHRSGPTVLYLHGGGFTIGGASAYFEIASRLARAVRGRCLVVDFRLAPEHRFPDQLDDAIRACSTIADVGVSRFALAGDSAGAGLALALMATMRDVGGPMPVAAVLMSPFVDMTVSAQSLDAEPGLDPVVNKLMLSNMARAYLGDVAPDHPLASPMHAELSGLPPMLIQVGTAETLRDEATRLHSVALRAGVAARIEVYPEMVHCFQLLAFLPETTTAVRSAADFLSTHLAEAGKPADGRHDEP